MSNKISVTLICHDEPLLQLEMQLEALSFQSLVIHEVVLIDTSKNKSFFQQRVFNKFTSLRIRYFSLPSAYPGAARNKGVSESENALIAFLDMKTIPPRDWLQNAFNFLMENKQRCVFGSTYFEAETYFQEIYKYCTYGNISYETVPGTLIYKEEFYSVGKFLEDIRSSEDLIWKEEVYKKINHLRGFQNPLVYNSLPKNLVKLTKRYLVYTFFASFPNYKSVVKEAYISLFFILSYFLIPRWNYLFASWDQSPFYVSDITKKTYIIFLLVFFIYYLFNKLFNSDSRNTILQILKYLSFLTLFLIIFRWNDLIANWVETSSLYLPHITKLFISTCILLSIFLRGIFYPFQRSVPLGKLFPIRWIQVGLIGLYLDIIKATVYFFGTIYVSIFLNFKKLFHR